MGLKYLHRVHLNKTFGDNIHMFILYMNLFRYQKAFLYYVLKIIERKNLEVMPSQCYKQSCFQRQYITGWIYYTTAKMFVIMFLIKSFWGIFIVTRIRGSYFHLSSSRVFLHLGLHICNYIVLYVWLLNFQLHYILLIPGKMSSCADLKWLSFSVLWRIKWHVMQKHFRISVWFRTAISLIYNKNSTTWKRSGLCFILDIIYYNLPFSLS